MKKVLPGLENLTANTIFCIGRNYALHAKEMKSEVPEEPIVFIKPNSSLLFNGGKVRLPEQSTDIHHEVEMVTAIGKEASRVSSHDAMSVIAGVAVGIDLTARDIQSKAKKSGHPWTVSKGFDTFAPLGPFTPMENVSDPGNLDLELHVNGGIVQKGNTSDMIFSVGELVQYLSGIFTLQPGDLIFTGTPEGVGRIERGDSLKATLDNNLSILDVDVT